MKRVIASVTLSLPSQGLWQNFAQFGSFVVFGLK